VFVASDEEFLEMSKDGLGYGFLKAYVEATYNKDALVEDGLHTIDVCGETTYTHARFNEINEEYDEGNYESEDDDYRPVKAKESESLSNFALGFSDDNDY